MKTFVIGDIHGAYKAFRGCLELSQFNKKEDRLICLGDVCDRGLQVKECIDELLTIPHGVFILGNHDYTTLQWVQGHKTPQGWLEEQGGAQTISSYRGSEMPQEHIQFLAEAKYWFIDNNKLFVHGGFDPSHKIEETSKDVFLWDRTLLKNAQQVHLTDPGYKFGPYDEIYIGHTPTIFSGKTTPQQYCNVWAMDTGAGWGAKLTIMDVNTKQFWQA